MVPSLYKHPKESLRLFLCCCIGHLFCLAYAFAALDNTRESLVLADLLFKFGALPAPLFALYSAYPRPGWAVFALSAITSSLSMTFIGFKSIAVVEAETGILRGGYEWLPLTFILFLFLAVIGIYAFHIIFRLLLGKPKMEE